MTRKKVQLRETQRWPGWGRAWVRQREPLSELIQQYLRSSPALWGGQPTTAPACPPSHFSHVRLFVTPGTEPARFFCPWDSPGKNTGVCYYALLQRIFPTQGSNLRLLLCRRIPSEQNKGNDGRHRHRQHIRDNSDLCLWLEWVDRPHGSPCFSTTPCRTRVPEKREGKTHTYRKQGLPWWLRGKEPTCQCRRHGFSPWSRKIAHVVEQQSPCATSPEPVTRGRLPQWLSSRAATTEAHAPQSPCSSTREAPQWEAQTPQRSLALLPATREKPET